MSYKSAGVLTHVRFDRIVTMSKPDRDECLARYSMGSVPSVGEMVNIDGEPYYVIERGWAVGEDGLFAYLRVFGYQDRPIP